MKFYELHSLRFECTQCGKCCIGGKDRHVMIDRKQAERVRDYLGLSESWFKRRYLRRLPNDETALTSAADGKCVFLLANGRCRVYPVRPLQCQTYPFWPENLDRGKSWKRESCRCEGIGRGEEIPLLFIVKTLQRQVTSARHE